MIHPAKLLGSFLGAFCDLTRLQKVAVLLLVYVWLQQLLMFYAWPKSLTVQHLFGS